MSLFLNLLLGHLLGDFVLQPGRLVVAKRNGVGGLAVHIGLVAASTSGVLWAQLGRFWLAVLLAAAVHAVVELVTIAARFRTESRGLFVFVLDQVLHALTLAAIAMWLAPGRQSVATFGVQLPNARLAAAVGILCVTFLGSILAFETANSIVPLPGGRQPILGLDLPRVAGMLERGSALVVALTLHPLLGLVPFVPRLLYASRLPARRRARQMLEASAGLALCAITYALIAVIALLASYKP